jgi:hypothetical protein
MSEKFLTMTVLLASGLLSWQPLITPRACLFTLRPLCDPHHALRSAA